MTNAANNIGERRLALLELNSIISDIQKRYGDNPPMEVRNTLSELAAFYRKKYGSAEVKKANDPELLSFYSKNGLL